MSSIRRLGGLLLCVALSAWAGIADAAEIELLNASVKAIHHLYVAPAGRGVWGRDLLSDQRPSLIPSGERRTIADLAPATYDLRVIEEDGAEYEVEGIEVETTAQVELGETRLADNAAGK